MFYMLLLVVLAVVLAMLQDNYKNLVDKCVVSGDTGDGIVAR